jgi:hypothetical protein
LQFSLICDDVRREDNGKFILIGLFEAIGAVSFPFVYPGLRVVNRWCNGEGNFSQKIRLMSPGNEILSETADSPVGLPGTQANVTSVSYLGNLRFTQPGRYWIEVLLDGDLKQRYSLAVVKIEAGPAAPPPPAP